MKKASYTDRPLTKEEKIFAEKNHNLIYGFLHKRGYSIEEYYQIAVLASSRLLKYIIENQI